MPEIGEGGSDGQLASRITKEGYREHAPVKRSDTTKQAKYV